MSSENQENLSHFLAHLTDKPGVYRMLDSEGVVLYVGKATNLKKRVNSYFNKQNVGHKTKSLVSNIVSIEITITRSETEALLLESNLIKSLRPRYNILMRDDKSYPYIHISDHPEYPRIELYRSKRKPQKGLYFGPYPSAGSVRETISVIQKVFKIRTCRDSYFQARSRPCLQFQIKRCSAPCTRYINSSDYQSSIQDAIRFLQGKCDLILEELAQRMEQAVEQLAFEEAAHLRDQMKSLRLIQEQQNMVQLQGDADVIVMDIQPGLAAVQCVTIRDGQVLASQSFFPTLPKDKLLQERCSAAELQQQIFETFISYYYLDTPMRIPGQLIIDEPLADKKIIEDLLSELASKVVHIQVHPRGVKARWIAFAFDNLRLAVTERQASAHILSTRFQALKTLLELEHPIQRMECFDISHTQGESTVASCVVFNTAGPVKSDYRLFNITGITPGDDYAAMEQVLNRRYKHLMASGKLPDVVIIDGGKGQITVAKKVLENLGAHQVTLIGIAKGPDRKAGWERLLMVAQEKEISLPVDSLALHLLQHIRDEAHRFAITAHRQKRQKTGLASSLLTIEGIGPRRRQALLRRFGGIRELAKAPLAEIVKVPGISASLAAKIYQHFHP